MIWIRWLATRAKVFGIFSLCWLVAISQVWADETPLGHNAAAALGREPNIIFILTDDQDLHMDSLQYMPYVQKHLIEQGTFFRHHHCTVALCCPSRASIWTGKTAHNTNVTDVNPPHGGYPKFVSQGFNDAYLPIWLQDAGYSTYYTGKLFNAHSITNYDNPFPKGWTSSDFLLDPYTYEYLNATFQRSTSPPESYEGHYSTDILISKALGFLDTALYHPNSPFFLTIAPTAPHSNVNIKHSIIDNFTEHSVTQSPPVPAERHAHLFPNVTVPRTPHFNPPHPNGISWISRLPQQNETNLASNDHFYRSRLRALQPVDELIETLVSRLDDAGALDNTYIFYTTDNGYHIGQHRLQPGKQCAYDEDVNIPFIVRGPGVPRNVSTDVVTNHVDLAPTFLKLAGAEVKEAYGLDGEAIPLDAEALVEAAQQGKRQEHVNVESWGLIMSEGKYGAELILNHTYKALRVVGKGYRLMYNVWCGGERELYDLVGDPWAVRNIHPNGTGVGEEDVITFYAETPLSPLSADRSAPPVFPPIMSANNDKAAKNTLTVPIHRLTQRLNALLALLKTCTGRVCSHPWEYLHTDTTASPSIAEPGAEAETPYGIKTLREALNPRWNSWYDLHTQDWAFGWCELGYIPEAEVGGPWKMKEGREGTLVMELELDVGAFDRGGEMEGDREEEEEDDEEWIVRTEL